MRAYHPGAPERTTFPLYAHVLTVLISVVSWSIACAAGDLMVVPTRLTLEGAKRSEIVSLTNAGNDTATYEMSVVNYRMTQAGKFQPITEPDSGQHFADKYIRFFPKQMTLAPHETQTVRIQVRGLSDAADGEYRSHLLFHAVPKPKVTIADTAPDTAALSIHLDIVYSLSIPIIIRKGSLKAEAKINNLRTVTDSTQVLPKNLALTLERDGDRSLYGTVEVSFHPNDGGTIPLGLVRGIAVYTPNASREFIMQLNWPEGSTPCAGQYVAQFRKGNEANDPVIARGELSVAMLQVK